MESRFPTADAKDAAHFRTMVRRGLVGSIELDFADPAAEHRLWIPDQILGAYAEHAVSSKSSREWEREWAKLSETIATIRVSL